MKRMFIAITMGVCAAALSRAIMGDAATPMMQVLGGLLTSAMYLICPEPK